MNNYLIRRELRTIRLLYRSERFEEALALVDKALDQHSVADQLWVIRGDLIQLLDREDGPPLKEAACCYRMALRLNPKSLEAIESLAHFYDAVDPNSLKAKRYAQMYIQTVKIKIKAMEDVVSDAG